MCSFDTTEADIDAFIAAIARETTDPGPEPARGVESPHVQVDSARSEARRVADTPTRARPSW